MGEELEQTFLSSQNACVWAALWKRAAKRHRTSVYVSIHNAEHAARQYHEIIAGLKAEVKQLRTRVAELEVQPSQGQEAGNE